MLGQRIKQLRLSRGISLSDLAERADVSKSYLSTIERDIQKNPSIQFLEKIADCLGISVLQIIQPEGASEENLDQDWINLVKEAMDSGIDKNAFKEFLDYQKWRHKQN